MEKFIETFIIDIEDNILDVIIEKLRYSFRKLSKKEIDEKLEEAEKTIKEPEDLKREALLIIKDESDPLIDDLKTELENVFIWEEKY